MTREDYVNMLVEMEPTKRVEYKKLLSKLFREAEALTRKNKAGEGGKTAAAKHLDKRELRKLLTNMTAKELAAMQRELRRARQGKKPHRYNLPQLRMINGGLSS